jgi:hypothetical protein
MKLLKLTRHTGASLLTKHQAHLQQIGENFDDFLSAICCRDVDVAARSINAKEHNATHDETPARYKRRALSAALGLEAQRHQDVGILARHGELFAGSCLRDDRISASNQKLNRSLFPTITGDGAKLVTHFGSRHHDLTVGQIAYVANIADKHLIDSLCAGRKPTAFGFDKSTFVALGQVAKDRAVQGRVGRLATGARPISLGLHRGDQLLCVHRIARFAKNLQGRSDAAQSLFAGICGFDSGRLRFAGLLENSNRCGGLAADRFNRCGFVLDHGDISLSGYLGPSATRTHFALQALSAFDENLFAGREVSRVPATAWLLGVNSNLASVARNVRVVLTTEQYFSLLHLLLSQFMFEVGCHRQADRTTDRLRESVSCFGLLTKDQVRQSFAEKINYHLDLRIDRRHIRSAIEVEHHFAISEALNPKLRDLAASQFIRFVFSVFGEDQCVEAVLVVDLALHPRTASAAVTVADLGDRQVEVVLGHLCVSVVELVNRSRVKTHKPCGMRRISPKEKAFRRFSEFSPWRNCLLSSTVAVALPSPFAAVTDLAPFDDVDRAVIRDVVSAFTFVVFIPFVHVAGASDAADAVLEGPVLLSHQPHFGVAAELFAVIVEDLHQGIERHVCPFFGLNENRFGDTNEPCVWNNLKSISAGFLSLFLCLPAGHTFAYVGVCGVRFKFGSLAESGFKIATVGHRRVQAKERRESVRSVLLVGILEDRAQATASHRGEGLERVEVFVEERAGGLRLFRVGDLESFRKRHQALNRLIVGVANFLSLVCVHRLEDLAKGGVDALVVVCVRHLCFSVSERCENRLGDDTKEPCGSTDIKPTLKTFQKDSESCAGPLVNPRCALVFVQEELQHGLLFVKLGEFRFGLPRVSQVAFSEFDPAHTARLVGHHRFHIFDGSFGSSEHRLGVLIEAALRVGDHPLEASQLVLNRMLCGGGFCFAHVYSYVSRRGWNRFCNNTHVPCGSVKLKPMLPAIRSLFRCFLIAKNICDNAISGGAKEPRHLLSTYAVATTRCPRFAVKTRESRAVLRGDRGAVNDQPLNGLVVFAGQIKELRFDRLPIAGLTFRSQFTESFVAKFAFVPTLGPTESVVQTVEFRFTFARTRSIPATLGAGFFVVVPIAAAFGVQGQFCQSQNQLDVSDELGFVERCGEGAEFNPILTAGKVRQIQKVVAIRFAAAFRFLLVSIGFDLLRVNHSLASLGSGAGEDRSFVVSNQGNQASQGRGVSSPANGYMESTRVVNPRSVFVDRVDCVLDISQPSVSAKDRRDKLAALATRCRSNASVSFRLPSGRQPSDRQSTVVSTNPRGV